MPVTLFREFSLQYERHWENSANTLRSIHPLHRPNCPGGQLEMYPESSRSRHYRHRWNFSFRKSPQPVRPFCRPMWRSPIVLAFGLRFWEVPKCYKVWSGSMCYASGVLSQMSAHLKKCRIVHFRTNRAISNIFRSVMARDGRKWCSGPSWWFAEVPRSPDLCRIYITLQKLSISVGARHCFGTSSAAVSLCMYCVARGVQVCHHTVDLKNTKK